MNKQVVFSQNQDNNNALDHSENEGKIFSSPVKKLIKDYQRALSEPGKRRGPFIHVDEVASKVAAFYEKVRQIVDWKEEHLIRRGAIERILKRKLISELSGFSLAPNLRVSNITESLVLELIRGGHFPNDQIPQERIGAVQKTLEKCIYILEKAPLSSNGSPAALKKRINFFNWILEIEACEIEEILDPPEKENALIGCMATSMEAKIHLRPADALTDEEKKKQIYIAVCRALFNLDAPIISYRLLKYRYPQWKNLDHEALVGATGNIFTIQEEIEKDLNYPLSGEFLKIGEKYDTIYLILNDVLEQLSNDIVKIPNEMADGKTLERLAREAYNKKLSTLKMRLFRMAILSTLSIFIASSVSLFIVEVPLAKLFYGKFIPMAIFVDLMLPTALMFALVAMVRLPRKSNLEKLIEEIKKTVCPGEEKDIHEIKVGKKRNKAISFIIVLLYFLGSIVSLGFVFWVFKISRIPPTSIYIDTLNIAVIIFAALVIRQRAQELVVEERNTVWEFLIDILSVPVAKVGQWLANKWREYNIISVFFTVLIDMPFSALIEFIEHWSSFLKEKKTGIR